jgi:hypothetical protein
MIYVIFKNIGMCATYPTVYVRVYFVAVCGTENPKPSAKTGTAKPNSTYGKKVKVSINSSTHSRECQDQSTVTIGT